MVAPRAPLCTTSTIIDNAASKVSARGPPASHHRQRAVSHDLRMGFDIPAVRYFDYIHARFDRAAHCPGDIFGSKRNLRRPGKVARVDMADHRDIELGRLADAVGNRAQVSCLSAAA